MRVGHLKALVLAIWAGFFTWLLFSGQIYRYIGPRTYWVVIFGAVTMTLAAIGYTLLVMPLQDGRATPRQVVGFAAVLVPIILALVIPDPSLGSLAASRKLSGGLVAAAALAPTALEAGEQVSFQEISYASDSDEYAAALGISDGYPVEMLGFVSDADTGVPDTLALTRFSIFCCAADAVPYTIPVRPPASAETYSRDTWIEVEGTLVKVGARWVIQAERIEEIDPPENPYI
jgi:uncharacterized repeat protein (TIGR03943 family)